jgi:hypothetical protein
MGPRATRRRGILERGFDPVDRLPACGRNNARAAPVFLQITDTALCEVKKYRAEGEVLHKAGKHQESLDTLAKAEKILGVPTN